MATETQLVGGGAPDPPFWLLTTQLDDFWFLPIDSSSSQDCSWKQTVSSMLIEPAISKCLTFYAYEADTSFWAAHEQHYPWQVFKEAVFGIQLTDDP